MKSTIKALAKKVPGWRKIYRAYNNKLVSRSRVINRNYPRTINIELTTRCNSRCTYCPRESLVNTGVRQAKDMDFELVEKIVKDIKGSKKLPERIVPAGLGESMLCEDLLKVLRLIKSELPGVDIQLSTNAIYFPQEIQHEIIDIGVDIFVISVNFHSKEVYRKYTGVDKFESVVSNTEAFLQLKGSRKPHTVVQIFDIIDNQKYLKEFEKFWSKRVHSNDSIFIRPFNDFGGTIDAQEYTVVDYPKDRYPCPQIFYELMINVDGDCFPCCMGVVTRADEPLCIGNIKDKSIDEIFASDAHVRWVRDIHQKGDFDKIPTCKRCNTWSQGPNMFFKIPGRWV